MDMKNAGFSDLFESCQKLPVALHFAFGDIKAKYRRSFLGPLWMVFGTAIGVAGLGFIWSILLKVDRATFIPSLTVGLVVWQLISGFITESPTVFMRSMSVIRNLRTPFFIFPMQLLLRQLITFGHNLIVVVAVLLIFPPNISWVQFLVIPGFLLLIGNLLWIGMIISMLGARFRDVEPLIGAFMPMMFFLSPVIYRPNQLSISQQVVWINPFSYFISLIRDPIQGIMPPHFVYWVSLGMLVIGWSITLWFLNNKHNRIAFWV